MRRQTYDNLPSFHWYQIYTAWWQLTAQDINPIAYAPEFTWPNFASQRRFEPRPVLLIRHILSLAVAHSTAMLSRKPGRWPVRLYFNMLSVSLPPVSVYLIYTYVHVVAYQQGHQLTYYPAYSQSSDMVSAKTAELYVLISCCCFCVTKTECCSF